VNFVVEQEPTPGYPPEVYELMPTGSGLGMTASKKAPLFGEVAGSLRNRNATTKYVARHFTTLRHAMNS